MSRHILLTGATGFVGKHLVPMLLGRGHRVTAVTRRTANTTHPGGLALKSVGDLRSDIDWSPHLEDVDAVVHLAALAHITANIPESEYDSINHVATVKLAKAAGAAGAKFIFISSVAAQSGPSADTILTEDLPPHPTTAYGRSKLNAEQEISECCKRFVILRPTLIYGPGVIGNMQRVIGLALSRIPPPLALIRNRRSLLAVENMCEAIHFALESEAATNQTFLVSDREPISTADIITQLRLGARLNPSQIPVPPPILFAMLRLLGRGETRDKIAGNLVTSVKKLDRLGFRWRVNTRDGLYALGAASAAEFRGRAATMGDMIEANLKK